MPQCYLYRPKVHSLKIQSWSTHHHPHLRWVHELDGRRGCQYCLFDQFGIFRALRLGLHQFSVGLRSWTSHHLPQLFKKNAAMMFCFEILIRAFARFAPTMFFWTAKLHQTFHWHDGETIITEYSFLGELYFSYTSASTELESPWARPRTPTAYLAILNLSSDLWGSFHLRLPCCCEAFKMWGNNVKKIVHAVLLWRSMMRRKKVCRYLTSKWSYGKKTH